MAEVSRMIPKNAYDFPAPLSQHVGENNAREAGWGFSYVYNFMKLKEEIALVRDDLSSILNSDLDKKSIRRRIAKIEKRLSSKHAELDIAHDQWRQYRDSIRVETAA